MYTLKQTPEDFIVREIAVVTPRDTGEYSYYLLRKKNYNTMRALEKIAHAWKLDARKIGYAGNKDKNAVTEQVISIEAGKEESLELPGILLQFLGKGDQAVFLGNLKGNQFDVTVRNLDNTEISTKAIVMPNFFGPQRFSEHNAVIGKALVQGNFKEATDLFFKTNSEYADAVKEFLTEKPHEYVNALKRIPAGLLKLYVHAYQSLLFNTLLEQCIETNETVKELPLIGFGSELDALSESVLEEESITQRDFIIKQFPGLSQEGEMRQAFVQVTDFSIEKIAEDELNKGKKKILCSFSLPKGCYATVLIDYLFKQ